MTIPLISDFENSLSLKNTINGIKNYLQVIDVFFDKHYLGNLFLNIFL